MKFEIIVTEDIVQTQWYPESILHNHSTDDTGAWYIDIPYWRQTPVHEICPEEHGESGHNKASPSERHGPLDWKRSNKYWQRFQIHN